MAENMCKFISVNGSYLAYTKNFIARQFFKSPIKKLVKELQQGFPGGSVVKNWSANAGDTGSIPGPGSSNMLWSN